MNLGGKDTKFRDSTSWAISELEDRSHGRWGVMLPDADSFWKAHEQIVASNADRTHEIHFFEDDVVLGFLGRCHLGDVICSTPLVRKLTEERKCRVFSARHRTTYVGFQNNPYLAGFENEGRVPLRKVASGAGHIIQKLSTTCGLAAEPFPKGELFLSDEELRWAWEFRAQLPRNRPVLVVTTGSRTDNALASTGNMLWQEWAQILGKEFTVVQLTITKVACLEEVARLDDVARRAWRKDVLLEDCFIVENLPIRRVFAVFAIADLFLGTNTGTAHVATALDVPCIIALPRQKYATMPTFPDAYCVQDWRHESFLYPQHAYLLQH